MSAELSFPSRRLLQARARVACALHSALADQGYLHVDTPIIESDHSATEPGSFRTWSDAVGPLRLRLVAEPYLKLLVANGLDRVYDVARSFRDEPPDPSHNLEYTLLEVYQAGSTWTDVEELAHLLITSAANSVNGTTLLVGPDGERTDLAAPWPTRSLHDAIGEAVGTDVSTDTSPDVLRQLAEEHDIDTSGPRTAGHLVLALYETLVEPRTVGPVVYTGFPSSITPQARPQDGDPRLAEQWDLVIFGREVATGATEATNQRGGYEPIGAKSTHPALSAALAAGLPPCAGLAIGFDRLVMTLTGTTDLRDVIPFPTPLPPGERRGRPAEGAAG